MTNNLKCLCSLIAIFTVIQKGTTFYANRYQICCQGLYSPWRGQYNTNYQPTYEYKPSYKWPESTYRVPHYFFKPPLSYHHYDPCRRYTERCHVTLLYKCCFDCCNKLRCRVIYTNRDLHTTSSSDEQMTSMTTSTISAATTLSSTIITEDDLSTTTIDISTVTSGTESDESTAVQTIIPEDVTITSTFIIPLSTTTSFPNNMMPGSGEGSGSGDGGDNELGSGSGDGDDGSGSGSGDGDDGSGSGSGNGMDDGDNDDGGGIPGVQRRHAKMVDYYYDDDFTFIS